MLAIMLRYGGGTGGGRKRYPFCLWAMFSMREGVIFFFLQRGIIMFLWFYRGWRDFFSLVHNIQHDLFLILEGERLFILEGEGLCRAFRGQKNEYASTSVRCVTRGGGVLFSSNFLPFEGRSHFFVFPKGIGGDSGVSNLGGGFFRGAGRGFVRKLFLEFSFLREDFSVSQFFMVGEVVFKAREDTYSFGFFPPVFFLFQMYLHIFGCWKRFFTFDFEFVF